MKTENTDTKEALEKIGERDWLGDVNPAAWERLVEKRGGCSCHISPPCSACSDPVTEEEVNEAGYTYDTAVEAALPPATCSADGEPKYVKTCFSCGQYLPKYRWMLIGGREDKLGFKTCCRNCEADYE